MKHFIENVLKRAVTRNEPIPPDILKPKVPQQPFWQRRVHLFALWTSSLYTRLLYLLTLEDDAPDESDCNPSEFDECPGTADEIRGGDAGPGDPRD